MTTRTHPAADKHKRRKPGPKPDKRVSQIEKDLGVSRRRAQQLVQQAANAHGDAKTLLELKIARQRQIVEKGELELARLRNPDGGSIPVRQFRQALETGLWFAGAMIRRRAEQIAVNFSGSDSTILAREIERLADGAHYVGLGVAIENGSPELKQIVEDVLRTGDHRYGGDKLPDRCREQAKNVARVILADEIAAAPPNKASLQAEFAEIVRELEKTLSEFSRQGPTEDAVIRKFWSVFRAALEGIK